MENRLGELWDRKGEHFGEIISHATNAVIEDLKETYRLAMQAKGMLDFVIEDIEATVEDAIMNNYDFLPEGGIE